MAKSKNGGSRAYIRGRIGSDVYSVGKDGKGQKQQVIRSLAVQVANPRTSNQMFGRMIMSTVMQAVSGLSFIIDHSFDGKVKGQPSISEFIRQNYALAKADAIAHPSEENNFGLNKYQEKGIIPGAYVVSDGSVTYRSAMLYMSDGTLNIRLADSGSTVGTLKEKFPAGTDGYATAISVQTNKVFFLRVRIADGLDDATVISAENVASLFTFEGNVEPTVTLATLGTQQGIKIKVCNDAMCKEGVIVSLPENGGWVHSRCVLDSNGEIYDHTADISLPTYPVGDAQFLNGGDI